MAYGVPHTACVARPAIQPTWHMDQLPRPLAGLLITPFDGGGQAMVRYLVEQGIPSLEEVVRVTRE